MGSEVTVMELQRNSTKWANIVGEIVKIERKTFPKHESLASAFEDELKKKNSGLLYMELNNQVVGYVMYSWPSSLCASITKLAEGEVGCLTRMFKIVKESCRRQGYGEALLKAAMDKCKARKVHRISLHVDPLRTPAMRLYQKLGFQVDDLIHSYYSSDRHAYRMYLDVD